MSKKFSETTIKNIKLKNRIIRSATHESMCDENGSPSEKLKNLYITLAKNEVGAIITGYAGIQQNGKSDIMGMLMIDKDELIPAYKEITVAVKEYQTPIIMQIAHCGRQTNSKITGYPTVAPSAIRDKYFNQEVPKELNNDEIEEIINNFVESIRRAKQAGFDAVQLHCAHGYLLAQFLSSYTNRRTDKWGGSLENKFRILSEIFKRSKKINGDYPIWVKMNAYDGRKKGMRISEAVEIAKMLEKAGCEAIEVSCGIFEDGLFTIRSKKIPAEALFRFNPKFKNIPDFIKPLLTKVLHLVPQPKPIDNYNVEAAAQIKQNINIPVIVVGGIKSSSDIDSILDKVDCVSLCRPFIIEPNIVKKFKDKQQEKSKCINCNYCLMGIAEHPLKCYYGKIN